MKVMYLLLLMQVMAIRPTHQACSQFSGRRNSKTLTNMQDKIEYSSNANDDCIWYFPTVDNEYEMLVIYLSSLQMSYENECTGTLTLPDGMYRGCYTKYLGCYLYSRNSSSCKPDKILKLFSETHPQVSCEKYYWITMNTPPDYFRLYTTEHGRHNPYSRSFTLEYEYMKCREEEPTTIAVTTLPTDSSMPNDSKTSPNDGKKQGSDENNTTLIIIIASFSIALLASWVFFVLWIRRYKNKLEEVNMRNLASSAHTGNDQRPNSGPEYLETAYAQVAEPSNDSVPRYAVGDAQDVYTVAVRR